MIVFILSYFRQKIKMKSTKKSKNYTKNNLQIFLLSGDPSYSAKSPSSNRSEKINGKQNEWQMRKTQLPLTLFLAELSKKLGMRKDLLIKTFCIKSEAEVVGVQASVSEEGGQMRNKVPCIDYGDVFVRACVFAKCPVQIGKTALHASFAVPILAPDGGNYENRCLGIALR